MKWAIKKGTAFLTMFALLVLMLVPTMSTAASVSPTIYSGQQDPVYAGYTALKIEPPTSGNYPPVSVTVTSGTTISFEVTSPNIKVFYVYMKGGNQGGNLYDYQPNGVTSDTGLITANNITGNGRIGDPADISHITFYYKEISPPPPPPTPGTITVTKAYSNQLTAPEVSVQLLINNGEGFVTSGSPQLTSGLTTVFNVPDITKTYKVEEAVVPAGYTVSYPGVNGQNVVFVGTAATVSILNTLNPTPPPPPTPGTITVTKVYSNEATAPEVAVRLLIDNGNGYVPAERPHMTVGLTTTFTVPDISKPYKVEEAIVPAGYTVSYPGPNGQVVVFAGTPATASVSILNTLNPTPPPPPTPGTITVTKAYSNQLTAPEVSVQLLINNGEGFVPSGSPQMTSGLTTVFNVPDITKTYKVEEAAVPAGYTVSYPGVNGQNVVFVGTAATVSILNTLNPTPPPPPTPGTITVTKAYSNQLTAPEVSVQLFINNGEGFVPSGSPQMTSGLTTVFNVPDITKTYKVEEAAVPAGYTVSYPGVNGQNVVFVGTAATVSILNTLNPTPPPPPTPGTITVTKAYSDQSTSPQVSVRLLINNGEGFEVVGSPQLTVGLTTSFNVPDITKTYKVEEVSVPSGYTVSYPGVNGQNVVFTGTTASVSILNTLIPVVVVIETEDQPDIDTPTAVLAAFSAPDPAPPVVVVEEPVAATAPEIVTVPEEVIPESAPVTVVDEDVPLAAPALPKTGELPGFLFYGLGTMISGLGIYLRRKSS